MVLNREYPLERMSEAAVDEMVDVASALIRRPAIRGSSESDCAFWLADYFGGKGYDVDVQEVLPGRHQTVAVLRGSGGGRSLMFNGHLDIDPLRADWKRNPFEPRVEGDLLFGAGARNMKGGVAAMVMAAEALRTSELSLRGDLVLACVMGELEGGTGTKHLMGTGLRTDMAILPEPLGAHNLVTAMPGVLELALTTFGFSEHVNRRFLKDGGEGSTPVDAIESMGKALDAIRAVSLPVGISSQYPDLPFLHVGMVVGGRGESHDTRSTCYVSDRCTAVLHLCYPPEHGPDAMERALTAALDAITAADPSFRWHLSRENPDVLDYTLVDVEPTEIPASEEVVRRTAQAYEALTGSEPALVGTALPQCYTAGDSTHLWAAGIPNVYYGPSSPVRVRGDSDDCVSISEMTLTSEVLRRVAFEVLA
jgi:acetylornithine deacetylase